MSRRQQPLHSARRRQGGAALVLVLVIALLGTLLVAWSSRTALLGERITGSDADYQRALQAAQAMVRDAELDIRGQRVDGSPCRSEPGYDGSCRLKRLEADAGQVFFPQGSADFQALEAALLQRTPSCVKGICIAAHMPEAFWQAGDANGDFERMKAVAARYGEFTGGASSPHAGDPLLVPARDHAWYWVEVLPYDMRPARADPFRPDLDRPFIYRITGIAQGLQPKSLAVVQTLFIWRREDS